MLKNWNKNIANIPGWRTKRKIVVIESDDWGSIRMSSKKAFQKLKKEGISVEDNHFVRNDGLESNEDLEALMETLGHHKDSTERPPVITGVNIVANPNFEKIKQSDFQEYHYEPYTETCKKYPYHDRVYDLWKEGLKHRLLVPVFHGREHLNVQRWMRALQEGGKSTHIAFDNEVTGIMKGINGMPINNYQAAFDIDYLSDIAYQKEVIVSGAELFERLYGYQSKFFIPTNGPFNNLLEQTCLNVGIEYLGSAKIQNEPLGEGKYKKHFRYLGKKSNEGLMYMTRNAFFEPSSTNILSSKDWVNDCLSEIEIAFKWHKPATISSHRVNYIGWLNPENRSSSLKKLDRLLKEIIKKWPDVEFMTSSELGDLIVNIRTR